MTGATDETTYERGSLRRGMGFAASSFAVNAVVQLVSAVVTARLYGVETIGEYALVAAPWLTLVQFSDASEQIALVRELSVLPARDVRVARLFFPVLAFSTALTVSVGVVVMILSAAALRGPIDQPQLVAPAIVVLIAYVVLENTSWNLDSVFSAFRAGRDLLVARLTQAVSFVTCAVALSGVSRSVWSLTVATVVSFVLAFAVRLVFAGRFLRWVRLAEIRAGLGEMPRLMRFSIRLLPGSIAFGLAAQSATWLLGSLASVATLGAYSRAAGVASRIQQAGDRMSEMVFPSMVVHAHNHDRHAMRNDLQLAVRVAALPLFLVASVGGGVASGALRVFGEGFSEAADAFGLLLLGFSLAVVTQLCGDTLLALGRPTLTSGLVLIRSALIVGFTVPGAAWYGATGAAGALAGAYLLDVSIRLVIMRRTVFDGSLGPLARTAAGVLLGGVPAFAVARLLDGNIVGPIGTIAGAVAGIAIYSVLAIAAGGVTAEERAAVRRRLRRGAADPTPPRS